MNTANPAILDQVVSKLSREQCLQILNAVTDVPALQRALAGLATAAPTAPMIVLGAAKPAVAPAATAKPAKPPAAPKAGAPAKTGVAPIDAIKAIIAQGVGFGAGDIAKVCGVDARDSAIRTGVKNALGAGMIVAAGDKRFMRYGATAEIALAASNTAAGK